MDSLAKSKLPVINIESLKPGTESWILACHKLRHTLEEYGCFMVVSDWLSQEFKKEVYANLKTLFDLPTETNMKNTSAKPFHGYLGPFLTRPLYESTGIEDATSLDNVESFANLMWPSGNEQFSRSMTHTDKNFLTILGQNQMNGVEVQIKDDDWKTVEFLPSSFVVMSTDAFMAWSNGRIKSPSHRVVMNGQEDRYSIGLFSFNKGIIEIPEELVDEEHPPRFTAFDHYNFLEFYAKNPHYSDESALEVFCGI